MTPININFDQMNTKFSTAVAGLETDLGQQLADFDPKTATSADMINLQMGLQKWTMATQLQSNALKTIGDGLKSTVSNLR